MSIQGEESNILHGLIRTLMIVEESNILHGLIRTLMIVEESNILHGLIRTLMIVAFFTNKKLKQSNMYS